jgi:hypothetical protein
MKLRSEQQILDLVLKVAKEDSRVRAVGMNGSRTNPKGPKDPFRDYDIAILLRTCSLLKTIPIGFKCVWGTNHYADPRGYGDVFT